MLCSWGLRFRAFGFGAAAETLNLELYTLNTSSPKFCVDLQLYTPRNPRTDCRLSAHNSRIVILMKMIVKVMLLVLVLVLVLMLVLVLVLVLVLLEPAQ